MILRGDPTYPSARALMGDYAVKQNSLDRSQPLINEAMDSTFLPVHATWKELWAVQQKSENAVNEARAVRYEAVQALNDSLRHIFRLLQYNLGKTSSSLHRYLPGGNLDVLYRPVSQQLADLEPYCRAIMQAPDSVIPGPARSDFALKYAEARGSQVAVEAANREAIRAQRARAAADDAWVTAFNAFHRAVELVAFREREGAQDWIRDWVLSASRTAPGSSSLLESGLRCQL